LKDYNPTDCDGCKEIHRFLTDPTCHGDTGYPMYDRIILIGNLALMIWKR
jgi:hypothetical protein